MQIIPRDYKRALQQLKEEEEAEVNNRLIKFWILSVDCLFVFFVNLRGSDTITWTRTLQNVYVREVFNINHW